MSSKLGDSGVSRRRLLTSVGAAAFAGVAGTRSAAAAATANPGLPAPRRTAQDLPIPVASGLDYAWAPHPSVAAMTAANYTFVVRYLSYSPAKNLTADEASALTSAGVAVVCNWEATAHGPRRGFGQGVADAAEAQQQAAACGMPGDRPIYFSVDWDVQAADMDAVGEYFDGVASVLGVGRTGAYSSYDALGALLASGRIRWAWQSCSTAFSNGRNRLPYPGIQLWQNRTSFMFDGAEVDGNQALVPDFGQWGGAGAVAYAQGSGGRIAAGVHVDGRVEVFTVTPAGGIQNRFEPARNTAVAGQSAQSGRGDWSRWGEFGPARGFGFAGLASSAATGRHADGRLDVFAVMGDGSIQNQVEATANGAWSGWRVFAPAGTAKALTVGTHADGRLELFAVTPSGAVSNRVETGPNGGWSAWSDFGPHGVAGSVAAVGHGADGRLEVFAVMSDGSLRNRFEIVANGPWSGWGVYGPTGGANGIGVPGTVCAGVHADGRAEVFVVTPSGGIRNRFETAPGGEWSPWGDGFGPTGTVTAACVSRHGDGRLEVFAVLADGSVRSQREVAANGAWAGWGEFAAAGTAKA